MLVNTLKLGKQRVRQKEKTTFQILLNLQDIGSDSYKVRV
jgi:hypothetical protein